MAELLYTSVVMSLGGVSSNGIVVHSSPNNICHRLHCKIKNTATNTTPSPIGLEPGDARVYTPEGSLSMQTQIQTGANVSSGEPAENVTYTAGW